MIFPQKDLCEIHRVNPSDGPASGRENYVEAEEEQHPNLHMLRFTQILIELVDHNRQPKVFW